MVRRKNVLGTMMQSMVALGIVGIGWVLIGYCLAFGTSQGGWIGWDPRLIGMQWDGVITQLADGSWQHLTFPGTKIPIVLHCMYQGMFAIITPALISGALAERIKFGPYCLFVLLWSLWCMPAGPLGLGSGCGRQPAGWLGNTKGVAPSTLPAARWCTSRPVSRPWRRSSCSASASAIPNTPCTPTAW